MSQRSPVRPRLLFALLALSLPAAVVPTADAAEPTTTLFSFDDEYVDTFTCPGISLTRTRRATGSAHQSSWPARTSNTRVPDGPVTP
jgi:hypothetical protein